MTNQRKFPNSTSVVQAKKDANKLSRQSGTPLLLALDRIAQNNMPALGMKR